MTLTTSTEMLRKAASQDPDAWNRFVCKYLGLVYEWCRKAGLNDADASDASQEIFIGLLSKLQKYERREGKKFRSWLRQVTVNSARGYHRNKPKAQTVSPELFEVFESEFDPGPDFDEVANELSEVEVFAKRMVEKCKKLTKKENWQIFEWLILEDQTSSEVAEKTGMTPDAIRKIKERVIKRLVMLVSDAAL